MNEPFITYRKQNCSLIMRIITIVLNYIKDYGPGIGGLVITAGGLWLLFKSAVSQIIKKDLNLINQKLAEIQSIQESLTHDLHAACYQLGGVKEDVRHHEKYIDDLKSIKKSL